MSGIIITPPRVDLMDQRTGRISREWWSFFHRWFLRTGTGEGVMFLTGSGAPTSATGAGIAPKGTGFYVDITGADIYINAGTITVPSWKLMGREA